MTDQAISLFVCHQLRSVAMLLSTHGNGEAMTDWGRTEEHRDLATNWQLGT